MTPGRDASADVILFPRGRSASAPLCDSERRFLLATAQVLDELAGRVGQDDLGLLRLHMVIDLRRPRLRHVLSARPDSIRALEAVTDRAGASSDQVSAARRLASVLGRAAIA
jgi:hypothetical protein